MSDDRQTAETLQELVNQFLDGSISDSDLVVLENAIRENPAARKLLMEYCQLHIDLAVDTSIDVGADRAMQEFQRQQQRVSAAAPSASRAKAVSFHAIPTTFGRSAMFALGALAAVICCTAWIKLHPSQQPSIDIRTSLATRPPASTQAFEQSTVPVAYLTSTNGCAWGSGSPQIRAVGSSVQSGDELSLHEGIAEFRLASGVALSIEGPAALIMTSPTSLVVQHGKVSAYVPWAVSDFKMAAGNCRITTSDAEFGVRVAGGDVDIHAFSGQLLVGPIFEVSGDSDELAPTTTIREADMPPGSEFLKTIVAPGRGLTLITRNEMTQVSHWHPADVARFATKLTMAGLLPIAQSYVDMVLAAKPLNYWRFEEIEEGTVPDMIPDGTPLAVTGKLRLAGDPSNLAAELGFPGSDCYLLSESPIALPAGSNYSVEVWMKPSHLHDGSIACLLNDFMAADRKEAVAFYLVLQRSSRRNIPAQPPQLIRYLHRDPPSSSSALGTDCYSHNTYMLRRWQHIVAVKEGPRMRLYVDGLLSGEQEDASGIAANLHLLVGQLGVARRASPFIGQLDELAIYSRALSEKEVDQHAKAVNWKRLEKIRTDET
jgi:hypothetical protein